MAEILILKDDQIPQLAKNILSQVKEMIRDEKKAHDPYMTAKELAEIFPYKERYFRDKISSGQFGKIARNGDLMAKYNEVEKYLFGK